MFKLMSTDFLGRFWNITIFVSSDKHVTNSCFAIWMLHVACLCAPWMLHVASVCKPCCMLLRVVAQSLKPVKLFSQQLSTFLLFRDRRGVAQQCWIRLHIVDYKDLWVVFFPRCTAGPNVVGSCCIRLHTTDNTDATTPNIVGATMLGVVAPVCTQPKSEACL